MGLSSGLSNLTWSQVPLNWQLVSEVRVDLNGSDMLHLWVGPIKLSTCDPPCFFSFVWFDIHGPGSPGIHVLNGGATR